MGGWSRWGVLEGCECIGRRGEEKLNHYIILTFSSLVHGKFYTINLIKMAINENKNCK